jgi:hypothetical protein
MLRVGSLIVASRNVAGFITRESVVRSMLETTNTHMTPGNRILDIDADVFKINCAYLRQLHHDFSIALCCLEELPIPLLLMALLRAVFLLLG